MEDKIAMSEAAILYYEKNMTQQEIANIMNLSRQTVSKLLNDAVKNNIVEIKVHYPKLECAETETNLKKKYGTEFVVSVANNKSESVRRLATVKTAIEYIMPQIINGNKNIAVSWGRTISELINEINDINTVGNLVFPLFGATDTENLYFLSNEITRNLAEKLGAEVKYAWFPYNPDNESDRDLLKKTSYYKKLNSLWENIDIALVGIGDTTVLDMFEKNFGCPDKNSQAIGDIATHFFDKNGNLLNLYENTLCATRENLKNAKKTIAIACGNKKIAAIKAALRTGIIDTLITDEYTAKKLLEN